MTAFELEASGQTPGRPASRAEPRPGTRPVRQHPGPVQRYLHTDDLMSRVAGIPVSRDDDPAGAMPPPARRAQARD